MRRVARGALAALVLLVTGCVDSKPSTPTAADLEAIDLSPDHTITVDDDGFDPAALEIEAGEVVRLVNEGSQVHTFTAEEQRFDTGTMEPGDDTTLVLTEPGEVAYWDAEAPDHTATITVAPAP